MRRKQRGFTMIEVSLALIITAFAALGTLKANIQTQRLEFAATQGDGLRIARDAGETYAEENYTALQGFTPVTKNGYTLNPGTTSGQTYNPSITDLISLGYLPAGFSVQGSFSNDRAPGTYRFQLQRTPTGCELIASGASCDITGFVYLDQPIQATGSTEPDGPAISAMAARLGGNAGFTLLPNSTQIIGPNGVWPEPNPLSGNPAGVIAARLAFGSAGLGQFVRIADHRDPNLQGNLTVAGTATIGGILTGRNSIGTSDTVAACLRAALQTDGQIVSKATNCVVRSFMNPNTGQIGVNNTAGTTTITLDGNTGGVTSTAVTTSTVTANTITANTVNASGRISGSLLNTSTVSTPGAACSTENDIANTTTTTLYSGLLVCRSGIWRNVALVTSTLGSSCSINGGIAINSSNQEILVCQSGTYVQLTNGLIKTAVAGTSCPTNTAMAQTSSNASLICQNGVWVSLIERIGKFAFQAAWEVSVTTTTQGISVAAPTCYANGIPKLYLTPKSDDQIGYVNHFATGSGPWNVYAQDGTGNAKASVMIAQTYCYYV